ncbi:hypothetical protein thalar_01031 [Litoreibacter arenae DSM 19593]|uniref:Uncharacterized protein n=1 Tax=Litoreibacter arenae DSM 19593 TaxID=1123360 RepID=S9QH67_9RHOB|nr:hypothetical protein thalar_01031 [Litoreibacter arenae DSM 19593]
MINENRQIYITRALSQLPNKRWFNEHPSRKYIVGLGLVRTSDISTAI